MSAVINESISSPGILLMIDAKAFHDLLLRVRAGEEEAAAELVRCYEPAIRRTVRFQLRDSRLRRMLDSVDICQSVLASFFLRAASGQYELDKPEQLVKLLAVLARNKLASQGRRAEVVRREMQSVEADLAGAGEPVAPGPSPSRQIAGKDLLREVRKHLSAEERELVDRRSQGQDWEHIASEMSASPEALRKRLTRALDRVAQHLGLDDLNSE
jgi:RNA polymerase sigma-70 factor (ECF subfamily)